MKRRIFVLMAILFVVLAPLSVAGQSSAVRNEDGVIEDCPVNSNAEMPDCAYFVTVTADCSGFSWNGGVLDTLPDFIQESATPFAVLEVVRVDGVIVLQRFTDFADTYVGSGGSTFASLGIDLSAGGEVNVRVYFGQYRGSALESMNVANTGVISCLPAPTVTPIPTDVPTETPTSVATPSATVTEPPAGTEAPVTTAEPTKAVTTLPATGQGASQSSSILLLSGLVALVA